MALRGISHLLSGDRAPSHGLNEFSEHLWIFMDLLQTLQRGMLSLYCFKGPRPGLWQSQACLQVGLREAPWRKIWR